MSFSSTCLWGYNSQMLQTIWEEFLTIIKQEAGTRVVDTWFKAVTLRQWDALQKIVYLQVPNRFVKDWIQSNYASLVHLHLKRLLNVDVIRVVFDTKFTKTETALPELVTTETQETRFLAAKKSLPFKRRKKRDSINKSYTFSSFVVGPSNSLAYAAAQAITENPGTLYNPLFLYGESGLGKTHLLHAIGNELRDVYKNVEVLYQTADRFVTEFINAIRFDKVHQFKSKYKTIDILLIDDIQFISNKEQTQEAFFHIFNSLYDARKQLVFSSDSIPQNIRGIAERLRSRLSCGLVADLLVPSVETKIAILKRKAETSNVVIADEVLYFIASHVMHNIRELEGSLIRVMAFALLVQKPITLEMAKKVLAHDTEQNMNKFISFDTIIDVLKKHYRYNIEDLVSRNRNKEIARIRQLAMFLMKELTGRSLRDIGAYLGGRDHSTVMHAITKMQKQLKTDKMLFSKVHVLKQEINGAC